MQLEWSRGFLSTLHPCKGMNRKTSQNGPPQGKCSGVRRTGQFLKGWFWWMFPRPQKPERLHKKKTHGPPKTGTKVPKKTERQTPRNRNEGTFAKTALNYQTTLLGEDLQGLTSWAWLPKFCRTFWVLQNLSSTCETFCRAFMHPSFEDRFLFP